MLPKLQEKVQCVKGERKLNFGNEITEILVLPVLLSLLVPKMHARGKWKPIVAMSLPKMGGKKKKKRIVATKLPKMEEKKDATSTIFFTTNYRWLIVIGSNLNLTLRLLFCPQ